MTSKYSRLGATLFRSRAIFSASLAALSGEADDTTFQEQAPAAEGMICHFLQGLIGYRNPKAGILSTLSRNLSQPLLVQLPSMRTEIPAPKL